MKRNRDRATGKCQQIRVKIIHNKKIEELDDITNNLTRHVFITRPNNRKNRIIWWLTHGIVVIVMLLLLVRSLCFHSPNMNIIHINAK